MQPFISDGEQEVTYDFDGESFGVADLCYTPPVPPAFKPYPSLLENPLGWFEQGAYMSYGYRYVVP